MHPSDAIVVDGTYIREPDGACLLRHSPHFYDDAAAALRSTPGDFRTVLENVGQELARKGFGQLWPGEYVEVGRE